MSAGSGHPAHEDAARRSFPYLSGLNAQRLVELLTMRVAPAAAAAALAATRTDSEWQGILMLVSVLAVSTVLRRPGIPFHLIPFASGVTYALTPLLGAGLAVAIATWDGYTVSSLGTSDAIAPVVGAWIVMGLGAIVTRSFRRDREVRVAVIGSPEFARGLEAELDAVNVRGYGVLGCIAVEETGGETVVAGVRRLGDLSNLRETIIANGIELLVLGPLSPASSASGEGQFQAAGVSRLEVFEQVADACLDLPVSMIEAGQFYEELFGHVPLGTTTSAWFQYLLHPRYSAGVPISKRLVDLVVGSVAALIALPLIAVSAVLIKLTDRGPVFHRQHRMGEGGRELELVKLRTMTVHEDGPAWTGTDDDRITRVGHFLRRTHIDELPQLWLVLKGSMSLVGPRPEQPSLVSDLESRFSYYDRRHLVKPGITGWAQVRCGYGGSHIGSAWKLCHDLYYLKRRSFVFDLMIMLETFSTVFVPEPLSRPDERFIVAVRAAEEQQIPQRVEVT